MPDGSALIEVYPSQESYSVRVVSLREGRFTAADNLAGRADVGDFRLDIHNPKPALRDRSVVGLTIASGLTFNNESWTGGKIYDPGSGRTYRCTLELAEGGFLRVRGYIGISLLGRTLYWQRADDFKQRVNYMMAAYPSD